MRDFPREEKFGLTSQIRRAVVSIPTNISEGCGKVSEKDFARFLGISFGSCQEIEYLVLLSKDLDYLDEKNYGLIQNEIVSIKKQLYHLIKKLTAEVWTRQGPTANCRKPKAESPIIWHTINSQY